MSEWAPQVVEIGEITKHPDADTLSYTHVLGGYPVIFRTGDYQEGSRAVYIPVDSVVETSRPQFSFLSDTPNYRIRAKRLRGIFSLGLLIPAEPEWEVGQDVQELLGVVKWEPTLPVEMGGENKSCPFDFPIYTDIDGLRRRPNLLLEGEEVVLTEKLHGSNSRFVWWNDELWVGSHKCVKQQSDTNMWWRVAEQYGLTNKLERFPNVALFGEVYGQVQDLKYGAKPGELKFAAFDAKNLDLPHYYNVDQFAAFCLELDIPTVPILYRGPWSFNLVPAYSNGTSTLAENVREGFVVRPVRERQDLRIGRVILKMVGEDYHLRKQK